MSPQMAATSNPQIQEPSWTAVETEHPFAEEATALLDSFDIPIIEVVSPKILRLWGSWSDEYMQTLLREIPQRGFAIHSVKHASGNSWETALHSSWQRSKAGAFTIVPQLSEEASRGLHYDIFIKPGTGFGTGEHPTTHLLLEALSELKQDTFSPATVFDLGTGSGILAIAAAKLWQANVLAFDVDPAALCNARVNLAKNEGAERVALFQGEIHALGKPAELLMANLYGEILLQWQDAILQRLSPHGRLLLSGIFEENVQSVCNAFDKPPLEMKSLTTRNGWYSLLFQRRDK